MAKVVGWIENKDQRPKNKSKALTFTNDKIDLESVRNNKIFNYQ